RQLPPVDADPAPRAHLSLAVLRCPLLGKAVRLPLSHDDVPRRALHSFPPRRSSDLGGRPARPDARAHRGPGPYDPGPRCARASGDRKSTRLNSSHVEISYAGFCLKKKTIAHEAFGEVRDTMHGTRMRRLERASIVQE